MLLCGRRPLAVAAAAAVLAVAVAVAAAAGVPAAIAAATNNYTTGSSSRATATDLSAGAGGAGRSSRILGGRDVGATQAVSPAAFFTKIFDADGVSYFCGGSLISPRHVLTRAGCGVEVGDLLRVGGAGIWDGLAVRVGAVVVHPAYAPTGNLYDVAVVTMADPPTAAELDAAGLVPARLNGWVWTERSASKPTDFVVAGFGAVDAAAATLGSGTLRVGVQRRSDWSACTPATRSIPVPTVAAAQVCTNVAAGATVSLCSNDGGGPLARRYTFRGRVVWQLFGVASYWVTTRGGDACTLQGLPNVYTRVEVVRQWIWEQMVW